MEKQTYEMGQRVIVTGGPLKGQHGIVKYFGPVDGTLGNWYGVELDVLFAYVFTHCCNLQSAKNRNQMENTTEPKARHDTLIVDHNMVPGSGTHKSKLKTRNLLPKTSLPKKRLRLALSKRNHGRKSRPKRCRN